MYLLITVINNEDIVDDLITGWLDIGVTGSTVLDSTDSLQLISHHIPIFAGFRTLTSGGMHHNKTLLTAIESHDTLHQAIACLETICRQTGKPHQGVYFVAPLTRFGRLGMEIDRRQHQKHVEEKIGRPLKEKKN